jgi:antiviral helicase SLH1
LRVWESIPRIKIEETQLSSKAIRVRVRRLNRGYTDRNLVYAPKFPKPQQESWFVLAVDSTGQKLLKLQRLTMFGRGGGEGNTDLEIPGDYSGRSVTVIVVSDGWRGITVEKNVPLKAADLADI